jgi:pyruvate dehydrogenase E2 component (dihydrolipoamide acetyltransferase)
MPRLGMTMTEGRVVAWPVALGGRIEKGAVALVIESEKAEIEIESPTTGHLRHVYVPEDRTVPCGTLLGAITTTIDEPFDAEAFRREHDRPERPAAAPSSARPISAGAARAAGATASAPVTPAARVLARERKVDLAKVAGTGPQGRVTREDVEAHLIARDRLVPVADGVSLEVAVQGSGETVLLVPGVGSDASVFAGQVQVLAKHYRVLGLHPRGIGHSDAPDAPIYDVGTSARDVLAAAGGPAHLVGASLGAAVAIEAAIQAPDRVRSMALITPVIDASPRLLAVLDAWARVAAEASPEAVAAAMLPWFFASERLADERTCARLLRGLAQGAARVAPGVVARQAAGLRAWSGTRQSVLGGLKIRTLVIAGAEDLLAPDTRDVADAIPGAAFLAVGGAGHAVALEDPDTVNAALLEHLAGA